MNKLKSSLTSSSTIYKKLVNHKLFNKKIKFGLKNIKLALKLLGNPEKKLNNVISILGESGKYTTLFSLRSFIEANNQTVATHTSPSLQDVSDRFWMGDRYLTHSEIRKNIKIIEKLKIPLRVYEVLTLVFIINAAKNTVSLGEIVDAMKSEFGEWKESSVF